MKAWQRRRYFKTPGAPRALALAALAVMAAVSLAALALVTLPLGWENPLALSSLQLLGRLPSASAGATSLVDLRRAASLDLAIKQMESIQNEPYKESPATYATLSPAPAGFAITISTGDAVGYTYANGAAAPEVLQEVTVTVTGPDGKREVKGYKVRR